jgi:hypothetical protein
VHAETPPPDSADYDTVADAERLAPTGVTLFVTGTSLHGTSQDYGDDLGRQFREREYRGRFCFRRDLSRGRRPR